LCAKGIENRELKCQISTIEPASSIGELQKVCVHEQHRSSSRELICLHDGGYGSRVDDPVRGSVGARASRSAQTRASLVGSKKGTIPTCRMTEAAASYETPRSDA
jgi:hypothetical protein